MVQDFFRQFKLIDLLATINFQNCSSGNLLQTAMRCAFSRLFSSWQG